MNRFYRGVPIRYNAWWPRYETPNLAAGEWDDQNYVTHQTLAAARAYIARHVPA